MNHLFLAYAVVYHEGALRASLQAEYGLRLLPGGNGRTEPSRTPSELAELVLWLPAGCAFWTDVGGPAALSVEARELRRLGYLLRVLEYRERGSKGEKPKPDPEPAYAHERRAEQNVMNRKAAAYVRRQQRSQLADS